MLILDTYNILHAGHAAGVGRVDATRLKEWIAASRYASEHVVMVYDGQGKSQTLRNAAEPGIAIPSKSSGITDLHAGGGKDADSVIEGILEHEDRLGRGRLAIVVSSDNRVRAAATAARAGLIGSAAFLNVLVLDLRKRAARADLQTGGRPAHATDEGADPARTEYWLREFDSTSPLRGESSVVADFASAPPPKPARPRPADIDLSTIDMERLLAQRPPSIAARDDDGPSSSGPPKKPGKRKPRLR